MAETSSAATEPRKSGPGLPSPGQRPGSDIVIYDGQCGFCRGQVERLNRFDGGDRLSFVSLHDQFVADEFPDLSHELLMEQMYVVSRDGTRRGGARAFRYLSRKLPALWILAPLLHIPFSLPLWQWVYNRIALRRYRISRDSGNCEDGVCDVHFDK